MTTFLRAHERGRGAEFFIGVDGGATRCRARLRDREGRELAQAAWPGSEYLRRFRRRGLAVIRDLVAARYRQVRTQRGEPRRHCARASASPAFRSAADAARVAAGLPGWARVEVVNDAVAACIGAQRRERRRLDHRRHRHGGYRAHRRRRQDRRRARLPARRRRIGRAHRRRRHARGDARVRRARADERPVARSHRPFRRRSVAHDAMGADRQAGRLWRLRAARLRRGAKPASPPRSKSSCAPHRRSPRWRTALERLGAERIAFVGGVAEPLRRYLPAEIAARLQEPTLRRRRRRDPAGRRALAAPGERA